MELNFKQTGLLLDSLANDLLSGNLLDHYVAIDYVKYSPVQIIPPMTDAFNLDAPSIGSTVVSTPRLSKKDDAAMIRKVIGYNLAQQMLEDNKKFYYHMSLLINDALRSLEQSNGSLEGREVVSERPGTSGKYFREMENCAGYEIRFFLKRKE